MPAKYQTLLDLTLKFLLLSVFLFPIFILSGMAYPFVSGRAIILRIIIELALILYIPLALAFPQYRPKVSILTILVGLFGLIALITSFTGINTLESIWGDYGRMNGAFQLLHIIAFLLMITSVFRLPHWIIALSLLLLVTVGITIFGILGYYEFLPTKYDPYLFVGSDNCRITPLLGHGLIYGNFMLFMLGLTGVLSALLWSLSSYSKRIFRTLSLLTLSLLPLIFAGLVLSGGRTVLVFGLVMLSIAFSLLPLISKTKLIRRISLIALGALLVLVLVMGFFILTKSPVLEHLPQVFTRIARVSLSENSNYNRINAIYAGVKATSERPFSSWGENNFQAAWAKYVVQPHHSETWRKPERIIMTTPHNNLIGVLTGQGLIGILCYYALWATALFLIGRRLIKTKQILDLLLLSMLVSILGASMFHINSVVTELMTFLLIGLVIFRLGTSANLGFDTSLDETSDPSRVKIYLSRILTRLRGLKYIPNSLPNASPETVLVLLIVLSIGFGVLLTQVHLKTVAASHTLSRATLIPIRSAPEKEYRDLQLIAAAHTFKPMGRSAFELLIGVNSGGLSILANNVEDSFLYFGNLGLSSLSEQYDDLWYYHYTALRYYHLNSLSIPEYEQQATYHLSRLRELMPRHFFTRTASYHHWAMTQNSPTPLGDQMLGNGYIEPQIKSRGCRN